MISARSPGDHLAVGAVITVTDECLVAELRLRREASLRLPPLVDGIRDPWTAPRPPLSVESARAAWAHLHELGLTSETVDRVLRDSAREAAA